MKKFAVIFSVFALSLACVFAACGNKTAFDVNLKANYEGGQDRVLTLEEGKVLNSVEFDERDGFTLSFWSYDAQGAERVAFPLVVDKPYTLYAQWQPDGPKAEYTVSFALNGGVGETPASLTCVEGGSVVLPTGDGFTRDYHIFVGWKASDGKVYGGGTSFSAQKNETLTAEWASAAEISFDLNGGVGTAPEAMKVAAESAIVLPDSSATKDGFTFDGWLYNGVRYAAGAEIRLGDEQEVIIFAAWKGEYTVSFDPDYEGAETPAAMKGSTGSDITPLPKLTVQREGYAFAGWTDGRNTYTDFYTIGYGDVTLKAVWKDTTFTITYKDWDGGVIYEQKVPLDTQPQEPSLFVNKLSEFTGWDKDISSLTGDAVVTAQYSVEFSPVDYFKFAKNGNVYYITDTGALYDADRPSSIVFPASYNGLAVAGLLAHSDFREAPYYRDFSLREVYFPSNWTTIGENAFYGATSVEKITFGKNSVIKSLGRNAFRECGVTEVVLPASLETLGDSLFSRSETLKSVRFEAGSALKTVSSRAFDNCAKLETVELPETVTEIGSSAFYYCVSLTEINFPAAVKQVGDYAFSSCSSLAVLDIPADSQLESIGTSSFSFMYQLTEIALPAGVTVLPYKAFQSCKALEKVTLGGSVTEIGDYAFESCYTLSMLNSDTAGMINIPASVAAIGDYAFCMASSMVNVDFGENSELVSLGIYSFAGNNPQWSDIAPVDMSLEKLTLPASLKTLGENALYLNFSVKTIEVDAGNTAFTSDGKGLYDKATGNLLAYAIGNEAAEYTVTGGTEIPAYAFYSSEYLKTVVLPASIRKIGDFAFAYSSVASINLGESISELGEQAFRSSKLTAITLPANLAAVSIGAFAYCADLESVTFADNSKIKTLEEGAFASCEALASIDFGEGGCLEVIGKEALANTGLTSLVVPATVKEIGAFGIDNNANLGSIVFAEGTVLETIGDDAFAYNDKLATFTMPASVKNWGEYTFQFCLSLTEFKFADGFSLTKLPYGTFHTSGLSAIDLPDCISEIGEYAFAFTNFTSFETDVDAIGKYAFYHAQKLEKVVFTGNVTTFGIHTFSECTALASVTLPETLEYIGNFSFNNCKSLTEIVIPASVNTLGMSAFLNCMALEKVTLLKNGVTAAESSTFSGCTALKELHVPAAVKALYVKDAAWLQYADLFVGDEA